MKKNKPVLNSLLGFVHFVCVNYYIYIYILGKRAITKYIVVNWPCTVSYLIDYYGILSNILI